MNKSEILVSIHFSINYFSIDAGISNLVFDVNNKERPHGVVVQIQQCQGPKQYFLFNLVSLS